MKQRNYRSKAKSLLAGRLLILLLILFQIILLSAMLFRFARLYWLTVLLTVLSVFTALHLLTRSDKSAFKLSLVFLILLLPVFGGAFYWIFHFQTGAHGSRDSVPPWRKRQADEHSLLEQAKKECPQDAKLLTYLQSTAAFPVLQGTQSRYFPSGEQMLSSLLADLEKARHYIFLEYFLIEEGVMWDSILEVLKRKAAQGVDVRVIYDDFGSLLTLPADYTATLGRFGIRCVAFNRFHPFLTTLQNNRDHRKITVIDSKTWAIDTLGKRYRLKGRLYEVESLLPSNFIRINKSALANTARLDRFAVCFTGAVDAVFQCGYREYVSRRCFADIKRRYDL